MLTDCAFWFIIVPFLTIKDYNINLVSTLSFYIYCLMDIIFNFDLKNKLYCILINWYMWQLTISMHTINAVFLLGDTALNCLVSFYI